MLQLVDLAGRLVVAGAFAWAAFAKLADLPGLRSALYLSRLTRSWVPQLTVLVPAVELGLAALLLATRPAWTAALPAAALLVAFTVFLATFPATFPATGPHAGQACSCFGRRGRSSPRGGMLRDVLLLAALVPALGRGPAAGRWGVPPQLEAGFGGVASVLIGIVIAAAVRRDRFSRRPSGRRRAGTPPVPPPSVRVEAPLVEVPALDGSQVRLAPGGVLLFVEPGCELCAALLPQVAGRVDVTVLAAGEAADVAALAVRYSLDAARVAVDVHGAVADAYAVPATPAACRISAEGILVDAAGRPVARLAVGVDAVEVLLRR